MLDENWIFFLSDCEFSKLTMETTNLDTSEPGTSIDSLCHMIDLKKEPIDYAVLFVTAWLHCNWDSIEIVILYIELVKWRR